MPAERTRNAQPTGPTKTMASTRQALLPYARSPPKVPLTAAKAKKVGIKATGEALIPARKGEDKEDLSIVGTSSVHDHDIVYPRTPASRASYKTPAGKKVSAFQWRLYDAVRSIELGKITTYGILAELTAEQGSKGSARAVGSALRNNPFAPLVPCHRIVNADMYISGFAGDYGLQASLAPSTLTGSEKLQGTMEKRKGTKGGGEKVWKKVEMLAREGVAVDRRGYVMGGEPVVWRG